MSLALAPDLAEVRQGLAELLDAGKKDDALDAMVALLSDLRDVNTQMQQRLKELLKRVYGRTSEKISPNQLRLFLEELAPPASEPEAAAPVVEESVIPKRVRTQTGRTPLPAWLPREDKVLSPSGAECVCADCGADKTRIGAERSELLEFVPATFKVIVSVREKYACPKCQGNVVIAPLMDKPIEGGLPGPGLLANTLIAKYKDSLPLERLSGIYGRSGVTIAPSTLGNWVREGAELLEPLYKAIFAEVMASHIVQADDTGLRVLDENHPNGIKKGHIWGFVGDRRLVAFAYTETWEGAKARAHLATRRGFLQVDGYAGLDPLFAGPDPPCVEVGCWAHARRKWVVALEGGDVRAAIAVQLIAKLYAVERKADDQGISVEERLSLRRKESAPIVAEFGARIEATRGAVNPKSPLGKALTYATNQWRPLNRFLEDGGLELDNNGIERALRAVAVGRKQWLFAGSDAGAKRAAILYSVIGSAVLAGLEPWAYMRAVIGELSGDVSKERLKELLPNAWRPKSQTTASASAA